MAHPGTYVNAPILGVPGLVVGDANTAVAFDPASNQYVMQDDTLPAQVFSAFTLGLIVKPATTGDANVPILWGFEGDGTDNLYLAQQPDGTVEFFADDGIGGVDQFDLLSVTAMSAGSTYRVIATWDGTTAKVFINGSLDASVGYALTIATATPNQFMAATNQFATTGNRSFDGVLDEVFFVANHAATTPEIATIDAAMTGTGSVVTAINALSPYLYWRLGETAGTVAEDSAGAGGNLYTPPIVFDMGPIIPATQGLQKLLFRHYSPHGRFETVWKLATDPPTYTLDQPYPLITPQDVQQGNMPIGQTYTQATYTHVYYGPELVDDAEAARLIASGIGTVT